MAERNAIVAESTRIEFRIGINVGDVIFDADDISEDIITDLSKLSGLHVIARNSTFAYKGKSVDVKQLGRERGVRYVLEGSVRKAGNRVRVTGELIDATSGAHIWADRFDRDLTDIFSVQDELTREIISAPEVKLTPDQHGPLIRKRAIDAQAYNLFLRARERALPLTKSNNAAARTLLERSIAISPDFSSAHACVVFTHMNDYIAGWVDRPERSLQLGLQVAERSVGMDDDDPYAHMVFAVALLWHREHDKALVEVRRCLDLAPSSAEGNLELADVQFYGGTVRGRSERSMPPCGWILSFRRSRCISWPRRRQRWDISRRRWRPSSSGSSATLIRRLPTRSSPRATGISDRLPKAGKPGRRSCASLRSSRWSGDGASCHSEIRRYSSNASKACARRAFACNTRGRADSAAASAGRAPAARERTHRLRKPCSS